MKLIVKREFNDKFKKFHNVGETIEVSKERYEEMSKSNIKKCIEIVEENNLEERVKKSARRELGK